MNIRIGSLALLLICSCRCAQKTDYIFPEKYGEWAIVVNNIKNHPPCPQKNGRVQVEIPDDGILITSTRSPNGILNNRYYMRTSNGKLAEIYSSPDKVPIGDTSSYFVLAEIRMAIILNKQAPTSGNLDSVNFDELIFFKLCKNPAIDYVSLKEAKYWESVQDTIIQRVRATDLKNAN